ncbi:MAG: DUF2784 domain-containing protein [Spirochaetales bacterium]|nr:DUF2784 domain-containing protein [Spirochaetales bacterium]
MILYEFLDIFFIVFHTLFTLFGTFGWIWRKTRKLHLFLILLTAGSWVGLGYIFGLGFGYCPFTDWHWQIKIKLGHHYLPRSYIKYLIDLFTGWDVDPDLVDAGVVIIFIIALLLSVILNIRDFIKKKRKTQLKRR